jgi:hypothetical protein
VGDKRRARGSGGVSLGRICLLYECQGMPSEKYGGPEVPATQVWSWHAAEALGRWRQIGRVGEGGGRTLRWREDDGGMPARSGCRRHSVHAKVVSGIRICNRVSHTCCGGTFRHFAACQNSEECCITHGTGDQELLRCTSWKANPNA